MILNCDCVSVCVCSFRWAGWADVSVFPQVSTFLWWQSIWNLSEDSGCKAGIPTSSGFLCQVRCGHHAGDQTHNPAIGLPMLVFIVNHRSGCECYLGRTGRLVGRFHSLVSVCWGVLWCFCQSESRKKHCMNVFTVENICTVRLC